MRVFIDTNVLISAALNPDSVTFHAYVKATSYPNHGIICEQIRDVADRTLFRAAFVAGADIIVTGDKDLLESGIDDPKIMTPAEFIGSV